MQNYQCKTCGAELSWDPNAGCLKCQFCDSEFQVTDFEDATATTEEVASENVQEIEYSGVGDLEDGMVVYECNNCSGTVITQETTMATVCPYCGEAISITSKSVGEFRPKLCIPFAQSKKEIMELYKKYVSKSFLTPKAFKEESVVEKIQGLFAPFYLHTLTDKAKIIFTGEKCRSSKRGYDKVTTHDVYDLGIDAEALFEKIPTDASVRLDDQLMNALEPFNYEDIKDYNPAYMAGFLAEQTDDDKASLDVRAEERAKEGMRQSARQQLSEYSSLMQQMEHHDIVDHQSDYTMLPVWMLNVKHKDKRYTFAINGQTGKVVGKLPMDKLKLALIGAGSFIVPELISVILQFM